MWATLFSALVLLVVIFDAIIYNIRISRLNKLVDIYVSLIKKDMEINERIDKDIKNLNDILMLAARSSQNAIIYRGNNEN